MAKFRNHVSIALNSKNLASILSKDTPKLSQNLHLYNKSKYLRSLGYEPKFAMFGNYFVHCTSTSD